MLSLSPDHRIIRLSTPDHLPDPASDELRNADQLALLVVPRAGGNDHVSLPEGENDEECGVEFLVVFAGEGQRDGNGDAVVEDEKQTWGVLCRCQPTLAIKCSLE